MSSWAMRLLALPVTLFRHTVFLVFGIIALEQMLGIETRRVIALVERPLRNFQPENRSEPMNELLSPLKLNCSVAELVLVTRPDPATRNRVDGAAG